jgi:hypothetical protein
MDIREELKKTTQNGTFKNRQLTLTDETGKVYLMNVSFDGNTLEIDSVYITPVGMGGFTHLTDCMKEIGVNHLVIGKVVNAKLAEHLARRGWILKASYGNWINFHWYV